VAVTTRRSILIPIIIQINKRLHPQHIDGCGATSSHALSEAREVVGFHPYGGVSGVFRAMVRSEVEEGAALINGEFRKGFRSGRIRRRDIGR